MDGDMPASSKKRCLPPPASETIQPEVLRALFATWFRDGPNASVEVRDFAGRGRGLVALRPLLPGVPPGRVLTDRPLVAMQNLFSQRLSPCCLRCMAPVGDLEAHLRRILANGRRPLESFPEVLAHPLLRHPGLRCAGEAASPLSCPEAPACKALFCSQRCQDWELQRGPHRILCSDLRRDAARWRRWLGFRAHARRSGHENLLLAAMAMAWAQCQVVYHALPVRDAVIELLACQSAPWHSLAPRSAGRGERRRRLLVERESLALLREALLPAGSGGDDPSLSLLFSEEVYARLLGEFDLVNVSVELGHPFECLVEASATATAATARAATATAAITATATTTTATATTTPTTTTATTAPTTAATTPEASLEEVRPGTVPGSEDNNSNNNGPGNNNNNTNNNTNSNPFQPLPATAATTANSNNNNPNTNNTTNNNNSNNNSSNNNNSNNNSNNSNNNSNNNNTTNNSNNNSSSSSSSSGGLALELRPLAQLCQATGLFQEVGRVVSCHDEAAEAGQIEEEGNFTTEPELPALLGVGLARRVALMNHSCDPNCEVDYGLDSTALVSALRPISAGEELTISYINEELPLRQRQAALREKYHFVCACARCLRESSSDQRTRGRRQRLRAVGRRMLPGGKKRKDLS